MSVWLIVVLLHWCEIKDVVQYLVSKSCVCTVDCCFVTLVWFICVWWHILLLGIPMKMWWLLLVFPLNNLILPLLSGLFIVIKILFPWIKGVVLCCTILSEWVLLRYRRWTGNNYHWFPQIKDCIINDQSHKIIGLLDIETYFIY